MTSKAGKYLQTMLKPIVRYCLKNSLGLQEVVEATKVTFMRVAEEEFNKDGQKVTISRLAAATGVHRKDAARIFNEGELTGGSERLTGKIIAQWRRDSRYLTSNGRPRTLSWKGEDSEFAGLVELVSKDLKPGTVLFELERIGAIQKTKNGIKLTVKAYVPKGNPDEGLRMLAGDTEDLIESVIANIYSEEEESPNYHAKVIYDNIDESDLPKIRQWFLDNASRFQHRAMKFLSKYDLDTTPSEKKKGGKRVALGIFTRT